MKKGVIQFFVLVMIFVFLIGVLHYMHFGGFTGFAVLNNYNYPGFSFYGTEIFFLTTVIFLIVLFLANKILIRRRKIKKRKHSIDLDLEYLNSDRI